MIHSRDKNEGWMHWMDAARCLACLSVILVHVTYQNGDGGNHAIGIYAYYAVASASIVFFMLTGALTLWSPRPLLPFLRERIVRVALPMAIWSVITLLVEVLVGNIHLNELPEKLCKIPIGPQVSYFWFIYVVMGIYAIVPILARWLEAATRREVTILLLAWGVTLFIPLVSLFWPAVQELIDTRHGTFFYFQGYIGLFLTGYYIRRWGEVATLRRWHIAVITVLMTLPLALHVTHWHSTMLLHRLSPNVIALGVVLLVSLKRLHYPAWIHKPLFMISQATFGIYLTHRIVIVALALPLFEAWHPNYWYGVPLATIITAVTCGLIVFLISRTRLAALLGCKIKPYSTSISD